MPRGSPLAHERCALSLAVVWQALQAMALRSSRGSSRNSWGKTPNTNRRTVVLQVRPRSLYGPVQGVKQQLADVLMRSGMLQDAPIIAGLVVRPVYWVKNSLSHKSGDSVTVKLKGKIQGVGGVKLCK